MIAFKNYFVNIETEMILSLAWLLFVIQLQHWVLGQELIEEDFSNLVKECNRTNDVDEIEYGYCEDADYEQLLYLRYIREEMNVNNSKVYKTLKTICQT